MDNSLISLITRYVSKRDDIQIAVLYGSFASGRETGQSDVDLAVATSHALSAEEKIEMIDELSLLTGRTIDLVDLRQIHPPLSQEVLSAGKILKNSDRRFWESLVLRMLYEVADFLPLKRKEQYKRIENIKNAIERIESKMPFTMDQLRTDFDLQDIISVNLQRTVQCAVDLANHLCSEKGFETPRHMAHAFEILVTHGVLEKKVGHELVKSVGLRNVLVHEYDGVDWGIVHTVANQRIDNSQLCTVVVPITLCWSR